MAYRDNRSGYLFVTRGRWCRSGLVVWWVVCPVGFLGVVFWRGRGRSPALP